MPAKKKATVRFDRRVEVHCDDRWPPEVYTEARRGRCWIQAAADRHRFRRRIQQTAIVLNPILTYEHRIVMRLRNMYLND